jgi:hypothetical protein
MGFGGQENCSTARARKFLLKGSREMFAMELEQL